MQRRKIFAYLAIIMASLISCFWAVWGSIENFHEGWHYPSLQENLSVMLIQYLSFMLISILLATIGIISQRLGAILYFVIGVVFSYWIFSTRSRITAEVILSWLPLTLPLFLIALFFWLGELKSRKVALFISIGIPLLICLAISLNMGIQVSQRYYDGNYDARVVRGNDGIMLLWAPRGPGWPKESLSWEEAKKRCEYLAEDGKSLSDTPQNIWRLPDIKEVVCSLTQNGKNAQGLWNAETRTATYLLQPDKEHPLWDIYSPVIYYWTGEEKDEKSAYIVVYHGGIFTKPKKLQGSTGFRAVKKINRGKRP